MLVLPDGGILATITDRFSLLHANALAHLKSDGKLIGTFGPEDFRFLAGIALQTDGKILVAGEPSFHNGFDSGRAVLQRFEPNGAFDVGFTPPVFGPNAQGACLCLSVMLVQPDQRILVSGNFGSVNGLRRTNLVRLLPNGSLDETFMPPAASAETPLLLLPDGHILAWEQGGAASGPVANLMRLKPDGSLDRRLPLGVAADGIGTRSAMLQSDGRLLLNGYFVSSERSINIPANRSFYFKSGIARFDLADTDKPGVEFAAADGYLAEVSESVHLFKV